MDIFKFIFFPVLALTLHSFACDAGKGAVYSFDPVGSYQRDTYKAGGSASAMLQPLLDNQVNKTHWHGGCITKWVHNIHRMCLELECGFRNEGCLHLLIILYIQDMVCGCRLLDCHLCFLKINCQSECAVLLTAAKPNWRMLGWCVKGFTFLVLIFSAGTTSPTYKVCGPMKSLWGHKFQQHLK